MCTYNLNRLIGTAVVDREFQRQLLRDPVIATAQFELSPEEFLAVTSVRATTLPEFAQKLETIWTMEAVPALARPLMMARGRPAAAPQPQGPALELPLALHLS